jgi:hypothetical protein
MKLSDAVKLYAAGAPVSKVMLGGAVVFSAVGPTPTGNMIVSGAGTTEVNGVYVVAGEHDGKTFYTKPGYYLAWSGNTWAITDEDHLYYLSYEEVETPDLITEWVISTPRASEPAPTITAELSH